MLNDKSLYAFVGHPRDYLHDDDEIQPQDLGTGASHLRAATSSHQDGRGPATAASGAAPYRPSARAFLRAAPSPNVAFASAPAAYGASVPVSASPVGGPPAAHVASAPVGDAPAAYGGSAAVGVSPFGGASVTYGGSAPVGAGRAFYGGSAPVGASPVGGASAVFGGPAPVGASPIGGASSAYRGASAGASGLTARPVPVAAGVGITGAAVGSQLSEAPAAGSTVPLTASQSRNVSAGPGALPPPPPRRRPGSDGARAGTSASHALWAAYISSDDEMLDAPLSTLPRRPRSGAVVDAVGARASRAERRPRAPTPRGTPSPSPTRRRPNSPMPATGVDAAGDRHVAAMSATISDVVSTTSLGFASVRREMTALKREVALSTTQQRLAMTKLDTMALLVEQVMTLLSSNRDILLEARQALAASPPSRTAPAGTVGVSATPAAPDNAGQLDATWIIDMRPVLVTWMEQHFGNARVPSDVWPSSAAVNQFLQAKTAETMGVPPERAAQMLQSKWRLPVRVAKNVQGTGPVPTVAAKRRTPAYRYLHRSVSHFFQRVGTTAVATFGTHMHTEEDVGTLRRVRGTRTKQEVVFSAAEATEMLNENNFLLDAGCRAALMAAAHAVFSRMGLRCFSEPGPSRGGPRTVACTLAHIAVITHKVRQHLMMRTVPASYEGNSGLPQGLNMGHREEWKRELTTLGVILAVQGARAVNGLRVTDGEWAGRTNTELVSPPAVGRDAADGTGNDNLHPAGDHDGGVGNDNLHPVGDGDSGSGDGDAAGGDEDWNAEMGEELYDGEEHEPPARGDGGVDPGADDGDDEEEAPDAYRSARFGSAAAIETLRAVQEAAYRAANGSD